MINVVLCSPNHLTWGCAYVKVVFTIRRMVTGHNGHKPKTATTETATNRNGHNRKGHRPKRPQTETVTNRNGHKPKRSQTGKATNRNGHKPERPQTETATNRNGHKPERPQAETLAPDTSPLSETSIVWFTDEYIYITYLVHHYFITYHNALHRVIANTTPHPVTLHHSVPGRYSHIYYMVYKFVNSKLYIISPYISHRVTLKHNLTYHNRSYQNITSHHTRDNTWLRTYPMWDTPYQIEPGSLNGNCHHFVAISVTGCTENCYIVNFPCS